MIKNSLKRIFPIQNVQQHYSQRSAVRKEGAMPRASSLRSPNIALFGRHLSLSLFPPCFPSFLNDLFFKKTFISLHSILLSLALSLSRPYPLFLHITYALRKLSYRLVSYFSRSLCISILFFVTLTALQ